MDCSFNTYCTWYYQFTVIHLKAFGRQKGLSCGGLPAGGVLFTCAIHLRPRPSDFFFYLFFSSSFCLSLLTCERQSCQIVLARVGADYVYNRSLPRSLQNRLLPFSLEKAAVTQEASHLHCAWMLWFRSFFFFLLNSAEVTGLLLWCLPACLTASLCPSCHWAHLVARVAHVQQWSYQCTTNNRKIHAEKLHLISLLCF